MNELDESAEHDLFRSHKAYVNFISDKETRTDVDWPPFNNENYQKFFSPPKEKKLRKIFDAGFELILPYLKRDLFSRSPCRIVRYDGTFSIAKVTMNDVSSEDPINCLVIIIGEFGHVMSWAYCNAEGSNLYQ